MSQYDGEIRINTRIDMAEAQQKLVKLQNQMESTADKIETIKKRMKEMETTKVPTAEYQEMQIHLQKMQSQYDRIIERQEEMKALGETSGKSWDRLQFKLEALGNAIQADKIDMQNLVDAGKAFESQKGTEKYKKLRADLRQAKADMEVLKAKEQQALTQTEKINSTGFEKLSISAQKASNIVKKFISYGQKGFKKISSAIGGAVSKIKKLHSSTKKTSGGFSNLIKSMKQMVLSMAVFQAMSKGMEFLKSGLQNLAVYSKEYNKSMSELMSSTSQLKNALAVAFQPILNVVIPILAKLVSWVSAAANAVSRFFAILAGKSTYTKAVKQNKDYAASLDKVSKSADDAKGNLADYDELNVMQKNDSGSGSGGSSSDGADGSGFAEEAVGQISDWAQSFKDAIEAGDWYSVGSLVAQKLNEALASIDWEFIQGKAAAFATNLALALNGFVNSLDWNLLGSSIGNGINTALIFAFTFLTTFDFLKYGQSIATALNSAISTTDFSLIGGTLAAALMAVINTGFGFVTTFDWGELGNKIASGINTFFSSVDWEKAGLTVSGFITGLLSVINNALSETDWQAIGNDVATFLGSIDWGEIFGELSDGVMNILSGINDFLEGLIGNSTAVTILEGIAAAIGILAAAVLIYNGVMAIYNTVTGIAAAVTTALTSPIMLVVVAIAALIAVGVLLYQNWDLIREKATEIWEKIKESISKAINKVKETISNVISNIKETWENIWGKIKKVANDIWDVIKIKVTTSINKIKGGISTALNKIKTTWETIWTSLKTTVTDIFDGIWNVIKSVINKILGGIESMANGVITGINNVIAALNNFKITFPDWVPVAGGNTLGFELTPLNTISIPKLANGGVTTGSTLANIGEAGREAVIPLERNTEWMNTFAEMLAGKMGGAGAQAVDLTVNLDGKQIYKRVVQLDREFAGRTGCSQFAY